ncbi:hypothetical protein [Moorena sp. SIO4G3]|uniref:hypothetical protein n=1 Tax=Moorena sp. SIO4G3 TaxID=2607821 RepID=UPI00142B8E17|nr:hypothetical protein [Moorena sp. SIO4G3]NEO76587.1 hypothetical protein [Moorena sp. SIO4G3]
MGGTPKTALHRFFAIIERYFSSITLAYGISKLAECQPLCHVWVAIDFCDRS